MRAANVSLKPSHLPALLYLSTYSSELDVSPPFLRAHWHAPTHTTKTVAQTGVSCSSATYWPYLFLSVLCMPACLVFCLAACPTPCVTCGCTIISRLKQQHALLLPTMYIYTYLLYATPRHLPIAWRFANGLPWFNDGDGPGLPTSRWPAATFRVRDGALRAFTLLPYLLYHTAPLPALRRSCIHDLCTTSPPRARYTLPLQRGRLLRFHCDVY